MQLNADYMESGNYIKKTYLGERGVANILISSNINGEFSICLEDEQNGVKSSWEMIMCEEDAKKVALRLAKITGIVPLDEQLNQLVLRARDDAELEQLKEAWSKGTINFTPIVAYPSTPKGEWQQSPETEVICGIEVEAIFREWFCPFCKTEAFYDDCHGYILSKFCPECGADLRGTKNE